LQTLRTGRGTLLGEEDPVTVARFDYTREWSAVAFYRMQNDSRKKRDKRTILESRR